MIEKLAFDDEIKKIPIVCGQVCKMGIDIKLIRREYKGGHKTYIDDIRRYENQQKNCPTICPRYKKEADAE